MLTQRLEVRLARESDRTRFVELFRDEGFMVFSAGVLTTDAANDRFDRMLARGAELAFAKQPVIERSTGIIVGYAGVDEFEFEGRRRLEFGYRLVPEARGLGYATEASCALLAKAAETFRGEILAMIDPTKPSLAERGRQARVHLLEAGGGEWIPRQHLPAAHRLIRRSAHRPCIDAPGDLPS